MTSPHEVNLGLIGCGWVTQRWHVPALKRIPDIRVLAVTDLIESEARRVASHFGSTVCRSAEEVICHPGVQAVAICVPPALHVPIALAAISEGKGVFIEKPLAQSHDQIETLMEQAALMRVPAVVGYNLRWHPSVLRMKAAIDAGSLGKVLLIRSLFTNPVYRDAELPRWRRYRAEGGGVLHDLAAHHVDLWRFLFSAEVAEIDATAVDGVGQDETAALTAKLTNGGVISAAFSAGTTDAQELEVYGTHGRLHFSCYSAEGPVWQPTRAFGLRHRLAMIGRRLRTVPVEIAAWCGRDQMAESYRAQWRHVARCVRGEEVSRCTLDDGRRALDIVSAAIVSADERRHPASHCQAIEGLSNVDSTRM
ncbi:MAG: Gfo/Idh/MocA family oxidoreductase [Nitrospiraceae bacterium]